MKLKKLASNASYLTVDWVSVSILSALFWVVVGKLLSAEQLGIISTSYNFATIASAISTLGIGTAVFKLISEYIESGRIKKVAGVIKSAFKLLLVSNLILFGTMILFSSNFAQVLKLTPQLIFITALIAVLLSISNTVGYALFGFQNMRKYTLTGIVANITRVISSALLIFLGFSFFGPLAGFIISLTILILIRSDVFRFLIGKGNDSFKEILTYSIPALVGSFAVLAFNNTPYVILTLIKDLTITGLFAPAMLLVTPLLILPSVFISASFPIISGLSSKIKNLKEERTLIELVFRYTIFLTLPLVVLLVLLSNQLILIIFKPEYLPSTKLLPILASGAALYGIGGIFLNSIYALKRPKVQQNILITVAIVFLILAISLTFYFSAMGMAAAYFLASMMLFLLGYINLKKILKFQIPYSVVFKILLSSIILAVFIFYMRNFLSGETSIWLVIPGGVVYLISLALLKFYNATDLRLIEYLSVRSPQIFRGILKLISRLMELTIK